MASKHNAIRKWADDKPGTVFEAVKQLVEEAGSITAAADRIPVHRVSLSNFIRLNKIEVSVSRRVGVARDAGNEN